jgi:hypothetical protein
MAVNDRYPVVLVVGFGDSVHTARWLSMVLGRGIQFVLLPVYRSALTREFPNIRNVSGIEDLAGCSDKDIAVFDIDSVTTEEIDAVGAEDEGQWQPSWLASAEMTKPGHLVTAIRRLRPVLVHSMVVQFGGYLALAAKEYLQDEFPGWLLSNWGSDIFLFRMLAEHKPKIQRIVSLIDAYHAECKRDIGLIRQMGFRGFTVPPVPATGGMDFHTFPALDAFRRPSQRRDILLKGYHGWSGRALHILSAVHLAADALRGYTLRITLASPEVKEMAMAVAEADGLNIVLEPYVQDHREALLRLGNARSVIGLGISDGISTTLLEAMAVGAFPIQGACSCGGEWIVQDKTGILVSPHDIQALAAAIRRAATDDDLVDAAAPENRGTVERRWNAGINGEVAIQNYRSLIASITSTEMTEKSGAGALHD